MIDLETALLQLRDKRPIFHNENDFQYSLINEMRNVGIENIRPEVADFSHLVDTSGEKRRSIDIIAKDLVAIELKYPAAKIELDYNGDHYSFGDAPTLNRGRYRVWKDVWRIEQLVKSGVVKFGYTVLISNRRCQKDGDWLTEFSLKEGRKAKGEIKIRKDLPGVRVIPSHMSKQSFRLEYEYLVKWSNWSSFDVKNGSFDYIVLKCSNHN